MKKLFIIIAAILLLTVQAFAMVDNGDGTRSFTVGVGGDFVDWNNVVWGVPAGVMDGDKISGGKVSFNTTTGKYASKKLVDDFPMDEAIIVHREP